MASYFENTLTNIVALSGKNRVTYKDELRASTHIYGYEKGEEIPRRDLEHFAQLAMVYRTMLREVPELTRLVSRNNVTLRFVRNFNLKDDAIVYTVILGNSLGFLVENSDQGQVHGSYGVLYFDGQKDQAKDGESWQEFHESVGKLLVNLRDNFYDEKVTLYDQLP